MNYTENYHLPQWEENDRVMRTDFNRAMAGIESGMKNAQATADQGLAKANTLPYAVGRYRGNDKTQTIEIGFRPSFVIISATTGGLAPGYMYECYFQCCQTTGENTGHSIQFVDNGFIVSPQSTNENFPQLNLSTKNYEYIAFK